MSRAVGCLIYSALVVGAVISFFTWSWIGSAIFCAALFVVIGIHTDEGTRPPPPP